MDQMNKLQPVASYAATGQIIAPTLARQTRPGAYCAGNGENKLGRKAGRILLLEDNHLNRELFEEYLDFLGYCAPDTVRSLAQFETYLSAVLSGTYDLVVMDIMLPDGESFPLARKISKTSKVPCMAYTARSGPQAETLIRSAGFCAVLEKPLSIDVLDRALQNTFEPKN